MIERNFGGEPACRFVAEKVSPPKYHVITVVADGPAGRQ